MAGRGSRSRDVFVTWLMWVLLGLFTVLAIGWPLLGRGVFLATEIMGDYSPWQPFLEDGERAPNPYVGDTIDSVAPLTIRTVEEVRAGVLPEWSPYGMGGFELAGLPNSGAYSPLSLPWWVVPQPYAPGLVKLLEIAAVTVGMSLFLRRLGLPRATWPLGSLVFAASGFMVAWTNWPQTRVAAFIPLLFWAVDRAVVRARPADAVPVGAVLACMVLGGFPAVAIYAGYASGAWGLFRAVRVHGAAVGRLAGSLAVCAGGVLLGLLLAAWQFVPFAMNSASVLDIEGRDSRGAHLPMQFLASMFYPDIAGGVRVGSWSTNPVEGISYVGIVALILISVIPLGRLVFPGQFGAVVFFAVGLVFLIAAIYFGGHALEVLQRLPTITTSFVGRIRVIVGFFAAVLAAYGFGLLLQGRTAFAIFDRGPRAGWTTAARIAACAGINVAAAIICLRAWELVPPQTRHLLVPEVVAISLSAVAAALAAATVILSRRLTAGAVALSVIGLGLFAPALVLARIWWPPSDEKTFYAQSQTASFLQQNIGEQRYETVGFTMLPGTNQVYGIRSLGGRGFATAQWHELLGAVDEGYFLTPTFARLTPAVAPTSGRNAIMDRFGVRYLVQSNLERPYGPAPVELGGATGSSVVGSGGSAQSERGSGPLRGIVFRIVSDQPVADLALTAEVVDPSGARLAETTTWLRQAHGEVNVALAGDDLAPEQDWRIRLTLDSASGEVPVQTGADGSLWVTVVPADDDGMRVVSTGDATVYEREGAVDRVRWADRALVETDPQRRLDLLAAGEVPADTVLLEQPEDERPSEPGVEGVVTPRSSADADIQTFDVAAGGPGWLVVDDSLRRLGWTATIDGAPAEIVPADHAAGAVHLPAGTHTVELRYQTPGLLAGAGISAATMGGLALSALLVRLRSRPRNAG